MSWRRILTRRGASQPGGLPAGSFTIDNHGHVLTSTLPQSFSSVRLTEIGQRVLTTFREAREARQPLFEISIQFAAMRMLARELRGGVIVFVMPRATIEPLHPGGVQSSFSP